MLLLLGLGFALWLAACTVVATLCIAAARGDRALLTATVAPPARPVVSTVPALPGARRRLA